MQTRVVANVGHHFIAGDISKVGTTNRVVQDPRLFEVCCRVAVVASDCSRLRSEEGHETFAFGSNAELPAGFVAPQPGGLASQ